MAKRIPLSNDGYTLVDEQDYDELSSVNWWCTYDDHRRYAVRFKKGKLIRMHRQIMNPPNDMVVDHINGDGLDNRRCNLRVCTNDQNVLNKHKRIGGASEYMGVHRAQNYWRASIGYKGKRYGLGRYENEEDAAKAYDAAARYYHGEFATTNFSGTLALSAEKIRERRNKFDTKGENNASAILTRAKADRIRELYATGNYTMKQLGKDYGVHWTTISDVVRKKTWWD